MTEYPCAKFGDFGLSRFGFIMQTDRQTESQNHRITDADDRYRQTQTDRKHILISLVQQRHNTICHITNYDLISSLAKVVSLNIYPK